MKTKKTWAEETVDRLLHEWDGATLVLVRKIVIEGMRLQAEHDSEIADRLEMGEYGVGKEIRESAGLAPNGVLG